jgi:transcriptional regulator with XRE-family HTH domain
MRTKSKTQREHGEFANALRALLDESQVFTRAQWAEFLGVTEPAISQWVNDDTLPRADNLRMIIDVLQESDEVNPELLQRFRTMASRPAHEVSPHGDRLGRSVAHYLLKPLLEGFLRNLNSIEPDKQERVLLGAMDLCGAVWEDRIEDSSFERLVLKYPPESIIDKSALVRIFGSRDWSNSVVISKEPYEIHSRSSLAEFYKNLVTTYLTATPSEGRPRMAYVVDKKKATLSSARLEELISDAANSLHEPVVDQVTLATINERRFEKLRELCTSEVATGLPRVVVVFDLGLPTTFGYSWFEDQGDGDFGIILQKEQIEGLHDELQPIWQEFQRPSDDTAQKSQHIKEISLDRSAA